MGSFSHLCPECLERPTPQCAYRSCPQRAQAAAGAVGEPVRSGGQSHVQAAAAADVTRAAPSPLELTHAHLPSPVPQGTQRYDLDQRGGNLATQYVDASKIAKAIPPVPKRPDDGLETNFVDTRPEVKR